MNILREPSRTYTASYDPPLEFMSLHSIMATSFSAFTSGTPIQTLSGMLEGESQQASGHFSNTAGHNHWIWK